MIISIWDSYPDVAGILATLLCNAIDLWRPSRQVLNKLQRLCRAAINSDDWSLVASVEPLAFAIAAQGEVEAHKNVLERIVSDTHWRERDVARVRQYYGNVGAELGAILRHWNDPLRKGALRANDVGRLMDLIISNDTAMLQPNGKRFLLDLLLQHAKVLSGAGEHSVARSVTDLVAALNSLGTRSLPRRDDQARRCATSPEPNRIRLAKAAERPGIPQQSRGR